MKLKTLTSDRSEDRASEPDQPKKSKDEKTEGTSRKKSVSEEQASQMIDESVGKAMHILIADFSDQFNAFAEEVNRRLTALEKTILKGDE